MWLEFYLCFGAIRKEHARLMSLDSRFSTIFKCITLYLSCFYTWSQQRPPVLLFIFHICVLSHAHFRFVNNDKWNEDTKKGYSHRYCTGISTYKHVSWIQCTFAWSTSIARQNQFNYMCRIDARIEISRRKMSRPVSFIVYCLGLDCAKIAAALVFFCIFIWLRDIDRLAVHYEWFVSF